MSGLELLGAIGAASSLLEAATGIIRRIRNAHERQKDLLRTLDTYHDQLMNITEIVQVIKDEEALQTASVVSQLLSIEALAARLVGHLKKIDPKAKTSISQLARQLKKGSKDEKELASIMNQLDHAKSSLILCIQVANVGLTRSVGDTLITNMETVERVDLILKQVFGEERGLKLAEILKNRPTQGDGTVSLNDVDIACLNDEVASLVADTIGSSKSLANEPTSRIVIDNLTEDQALQINGPVGERGWKEVVQLEIRNNKATGTSIQVNHAVSTEVFERLMAARVEA